jgi:perosamine synthetase
MARVQLRHYPERMAEIQQAMNYFWDGLEGVPGLRAHRPAKGSGSTMGGWYNPLGHYRPEELGGLSLDRFLQAVNAEGCRAWRAANTPLHLHPVFNTADIYGDGKPTRIAFADRDLRQGPGSLPITEALRDRCYGIPWFKHYRPQQIDAFIQAYRKVALQADKLKED